MSYKYREEADVHLYTKATFTVLDVQKKKTHVQWLQ